MCQVSHFLFVRLRFLILYIASGLKLSAQLIRFDLCFFDFIGAAFLHRCQLLLRVVQT